MLINANLEVNQAINNPEGSVELRQNSHLILFAQATMRALNIRQSDGSATAIPAGTYNVSSWTTTAEGLGIDPLQVDLMGGAERPCSRPSDYRLKAVFLRARAPGNQHPTGVKAFPPMGAMPLSMDRLK